MTTPSITVIVLAFNEEGNLPAMLDESIAYLARCVPSWEIVIVDDGSSDGTPAVASSYADAHPANVRVLTHEQNRGMGAGMKTGIRGASSEYFTIIAGDGQHPTPELERMIPALAQADIVTTFHENQREASRRFLSWGFRKAMWLACGIDFELEGIYLFPRRVALDEIGLDNIPGDTFFFSFELIARALRSGYRVATVPMEVRRRVHGSSKVAGVGRIRRIFSEIMDFRGRLKAESTPASRQSPS